MRIKGGVYTRHRKKKYLKIAKSYYSDRGRRWRLVKQQVERSLRFSYRHRREKKRTMRRLWITRINAATRETGLTYSKLMAALKKHNIQLNRKALAHLAVTDPENFKQLVGLAKESQTTA